MKGLAAGRWMAAASLWMVACSASGGGVSFGDGGPAGAGGYVPTGGVANPDAATGGGPPSGGGTVSGGTGAVGAMGGMGAVGAMGGMGSVAGTGVGSSSGGGAPPDAGPDASSGGTDGGAAYGDCCSVHSAPGCSESSIKQCVCNIDPTCCSLGWNLKCIQTATQYQCAACPDGGVPGSGGSGGSGGTTGGGDCCFAKSTAGCSNPTVQACVCAVDSYCCQYSWDSICASEVVSAGCGTC